MKEEKKELGLWMLTALVTGNIVGSGVYLLPAVLASYGTISILGWLFTAVGVVFLALVFSRLSRLIPKAGGPYAYCREAYGDFIGFQVAYNYWVYIWVGNAAISVALVSYLSVFFPTLLSNSMLAILVALGVLWSLTGLNILSIRFVGKFQIVTAVLKLLPLLLMGTVGLFFIHAGNYQGNFNVSGQSNWHALIAVSALTLWSFIGFESATVPAEHVKDPAKTIPRATLLGTLIAVVVYIASTVAVMGVMPLGELAHSSAPYADAASIVFGSWIGKFVALSAVISCLGALSGWILLQGQMPMAAAEEELFPAAFARKNKNGLPWLGLVISSVLVSALLLMRYGVSLVDQFTFIILLATFSALIPYIYTSLAEMILMIKKPEMRSKVRMSRVLVIAILAFLFSFLAVVGAGRDVVFYGMLLFLSGIPLYLWMVWRKSISDH